MPDLLSIYRKHKNVSAKTICFLLGMVTAGIFFLSYNYAARRAATKTTEDCQGNASMPGVHISVSESPGSDITPNALFNRFF
ncbi:hypothetical protein DXN05_22475 [Deminuibacter soli]|uniref:Uncharacterized protein n=1 Tax=Deminuibacter soli TaxID=2291815 RepID=A0A3E1NDG4_9BACT|nr:hypothetical protein DXN05_22475 [Deminuibacter soli]